MTNPRPAARHGLLDRLLHTVILDNTQLTPSPKNRPTGPAVWPGLYLGNGLHGPVHGGAQHHALVIGPPRSGKTTRLVVPNLLTHPGPAVVTSTKPDVLHATLAARQEKGTCWLWDPTGTIPLPNAVEELRWSPLAGCDSWDRAIATAHALATAARPDRHSYDTHWVERAQAVLAPLLHAAAMCGATLATVTSWLHRRELIQPLALLQEHRSLIAADVLQGVSVTDPRELSGILSTADGILAAYRSEATLKATRDPNFDPEHFPTTGDTIYLCPPGTTQALHAPLIVALLDQIRDATYRQPPRPPMLWALDEVANIAPLPDLPTVIAEGGSQGLIVLACLQDLSQARNRWQKEADGFLTLFTHTLVLPGIADTTTLRQISALAGQIDIPRESHTRQPGRPESTTVNLVRQPRLPIDAIATGHPGEALLLTRTIPSRVRL